LQVWQKATKIIILQQFNNAATWPFWFVECVGVRFGLNLADVQDGKKDIDDCMTRRHNIEQQRNI
jgi:hypothetical protein